MTRNAAALVASVVGVVEVTPDAYEPVPVARAVAVVPVVPADADVDE
jgi:hypothetical protein